MSPVIFVNMSSESVTGETYTLFLYVKIIKMSGVSIRVNVFDMTSVNKAMRKSCLCVYHTSVVIDEKIELYYGFKDVGLTGIDNASKLDELPNSMSGTFYKTYHVGRSKRSLQYCRTMIKRFRADPSWDSSRYNIVSNNCHSFAWALCEALLGSGNMHRFPRFVFDCNKVTSALYNGIVKHFIDEEHPPYFLGKQENMPQPSYKFEPRVLCNEIMVY